MTRSSRGHGYEGSVWFFPFVHDPVLVSEPDAVGTGGLDSAQSSQLDRFLRRMERGKAAGEEQMLMQQIRISIRTPAAGRIRPVEERGVAMKVRKRGYASSTHVVCKELHVSIHKGSLCQRFHYDCLALKVQWCVRVHQPKIYWQATALHSRSDSEGCQGFTDSAGASQVLLDD